MALEYVLKNNGVDPNKDVNMVTNIDFTATSGAFKSGTGEYVALFEPTATMLEREGSGHIVASIGENLSKEVVVKSRDRIKNIIVWFYRFISTERKEFKFSKIFIESINSKTFYKFYENGYKFVFYNFFESAPNEVKETKAWLYTLNWHITNFG